MTKNDDRTSGHVAKPGLAAAQAGAGVSLSSNEGLENWQQGFAAGTEAFAAWLDAELKDAPEEWRVLVDEGRRALRPAETAKDYFDQEWRWAKNQTAKEVMQHSERSSKPDLDKTPPLSASEPAGATMTPAVQAVLSRPVPLPRNDDAVMYDPQGAVMGSEYPVPQAAADADYDLIEACVEDIAENWPGGWNQKTFDAAKKAVRVIIGRVRAEPTGLSEEDVARMAEAIQKSTERGCDITPPESMVAARAAYLALRAKEPAGPSEEELAAVIGHGSKTIICGRAGYDTLETARAVMALLQRGKK